ncbi:ubiquinol oxidase subunit II [Aquibacillus sp. 3ASR75-11]|uniref:Quinol oxidase subunit 2 n=1 Tax=Terrihalobacillus insolitus TaxID=2950438 RepID=A0A9X4APT1_9BACI|nr:ubiquinol oxidase subunit II [Terrihalobacillus insolitus]MDC3415005.1 ubiquinol oxidase subunit II [Terrihalobacillus insolitus]MDC3425860.1 ubiquinol oxidase subunit II [Terrihalobacillus insolitus]
MSFRNLMKRISKISLILFLTTLLSACSNADYIVLDPKGPVGQIQANLIWTSVILLASVIVPVLLLFVFIVIRYRDKPGNRAPFKPEWDDNKTLEIIWWGIPILLIGVLGFFTVRDTFVLEEPPSKDVEPMTIQVTSLDWKWLFQYPEQEIATVNYLQIPTDTPINFELTTDAPINSFWVPQLGGQKYTLPGKTLSLWLEAEEEGTYFGTANNFSGKDFTKMKFDVIAKSNDEFQQWVNEVKQSSKPLTLNDYQELSKQSVVGTSEYSTIPADLFEYIVDKNGGQYYRSNNHTASDHDRKQLELSNNE